MTLAAVLLILASSFLHAGWNLLSKGTNSGPRVFLQANLTGMLLLLPLALVFRRVALAMPRPVVLLVLVTGLFQMIYYVALSRSYRAGEMSVAYPLLRSLPIVMVALVELIAGEASALTPAAIAGFLLIVLGCLFLPLERFRDFRVRNYLHATILLAVVAAVGTTGYSVVDSSALAVFRRAAIGTTHPTIVAPIVYSFFEAMSSALWVGAYMLVERGFGRRLAASAPGSEAAPRGEAAPRASEPKGNGARTAILMGIGIYVTYTMVLVSMGLVTNVSYVVAFRQASIPIGVALSIAFLKERPFVPKLTGVAVVTLGLVLTALS